MYEYFYTQIFCESVSAFANLNLKRVFTLSWMVDVYIEVLSTMMNSFRNTANYVTTVTANYCCQLVL